jgi:hypothetical protein
MIGAGIAVVVLGCTATLLLSLKLPWPQRVHWLVAVNALGCWGSPTQPVTMREVFVVDVDDPPESSIVVRAAGTAAGNDMTVLVTGGSARADVAHSVTWRAAGTPLLLVSDGGVQVSIQNATRTVRGCLAPPTTRSEPGRPLPADLQACIDAPNRPLTAS